MHDQPSSPGDAGAETVRVALASAWRRDSAVHGEQHWWCVAATGLDLAAGVPGADRELTLLFGLLHDTRRENDSHDPEHGPRASLYARELHAAGTLRLGADRLELLCHAMDQHTLGLRSDDPTVGVCWDADRLHLPRVGTTLDPARFSTSVALGTEQVLRAAERRAQAIDWPLLVGRALT
jgi:uncharacterized protein